MHYSTVKAVNYSVNTARPNSAVAFIAVLHSNFPILKSERRKKTILGVLVLLLVTYLISQQQSALFRKQVYMLTELKSVYVCVCVCICVHMNSDIFDQTA